MDCVILHLLMESANIGFSLKIRKTAQKRAQKPPGRAVREQKKRTPGKGCARCAPDRHGRLAS